MSETGRDAIRRGVYRWRRIDGSDDEDDAGKDAGISSEDGRNIKTISLWEKRLCEKKNKKKIKPKKKKKVQRKVEKHYGNDANKSRKIYKKCQIGDSKMSSFMNLENVEKRIRGKK